MKPRSFPPGAVARFTAAVHRREADARRLTQSAFATVLDGWAKDADLRAAKAEADEQPDLFTTPDTEALATLEEPVFISMEGR